MKRSFILITSVALVITSSFRMHAQYYKPVFESKESVAWADSVFKKMSYEEKIGQLFMVAAFSNRDSAHVSYITGLIDSLHIGGIIFFQGGPIRQAALTNFYQQRSAIPLLVAIDGEWGLSMRLDSTIRFPRQMTLSASGQDSLIYKMGAEIARQCKLLGIHVNFAPVVDINNNPRNPVINSRSFGENKIEVTKNSLQYMKGMQDNHVLACAKHFPGHGNTDSDSHFSLPVINQSAEEMDSMELFPFKSMIKEKLGSVMVAHLFIPSLDTTFNLASTLSKPIITGLLKEKLKFNGLIFTDALDMKGVAKDYLSGELELRALLAGNDVLLNTENVYVAVNRLHYAIQNCEIEQVEIDEHVMKILMTKYWCGLNNFSPVDFTKVNNEMQTAEAQWLNYRLYENSITLLKNEDVIPIRPFQEKKIASVVVNDAQDNLFQQTLNTYAHVDCFAITKDVAEIEIAELFIKLKSYDQVIVSVHNTSTNASRNFNITEQMQSAVKKFSTLSNDAICLFGNCYTLSKFETLADYKAIVVSFEDTYLPQYFTAQALFGGNSFRGKLPVTPVAEYAYGSGIRLEQNQSFKFTLPEEVVSNQAMLEEIDTIIAHSIRDSIFPGCQLLAARNGKIFYNKAYGNPIYGDTAKVRTTDLYDIASVSKIASTALAAMRLFDRGRLDLAVKISKYLPELKRSNKKDILLGDLMAHQAGLQAWIPFYKNTLKNGSPADSIYRKVADERFNIMVSDSLYMDKRYLKVMWKELLKSPVTERGHYVYSDIGLIILQKIIERMTDEPLDVFVKKTFYEPLGLWRMTYKPLGNFSRAEIIPTELDSFFRQQLVHGYVHDPAAAMMGGVGGQAGVFSNAQSLSVIMQLLLNGGEYGGRRYLKKETVDLFTQQAFPGTANRRGFLFDKPVTSSSNSPAAADASSQAFGHLGFTGTCAWADPQNKLVYIFLSNRVYPSAENTKLAKQNIRTEVMQLFYDAVK